jgi:hypothetical protein
MDVQCAACGSSRLLKQTRLITRNTQASEEVFLHMPPAGTLGLLQLKSEVRGSTCVDCGHLQFHAVSREELLMAYERQQQQPNGLGLIKFDS